MPVDPLVCYCTNDKKDTYTMRELVWIAILSVSTGLSGCSSQAIYNDLQRNFQAQCYEKFIGSALQECLERYNTPYRSFKRQNEELLGKEKTPSLTEFEKSKAKDAEEKAKTKY